MPDTWAHLADRIEEAYGPKARSPCRARAETLARSTQGRVLDLGCGPGHELSLFARGVGLDSSPAMLKAGRSRAPSAGLVLADMRWLPFMPGSVSAAFSCFALIHLSKAGFASALRQLRVVLEPGGRLVAGMFAGEGEKDTGFSHLDPDAVAHYSYYGPDELKRIFREEGFDVEGCDEEDMQEPTATVPTIWISARARHRS